MFSGAAAIKSLGSVYLYVLAVMPEGLGEYQLASPVIVTSVVKPVEIA
jgi:hypothetical protein